MMLPRFADGNRLHATDLYDLAGFSAALVGSAFVALGVEGFFRPRGHSGPCNAVQSEGVQQLHAIIGGRVLVVPEFSIPPGNGTLWARIRVASTIAERDQWAASGGIGLDVLFAPSTAAPPPQSNPGNGYCAVLDRHSTAITLLLPCLTLDAVDGVRDAFQEAVNRALRARTNALQADMDAEAALVAIDALERFRLDDPPDRGVEAISAVLAACYGLLLRQRHKNDPSLNVPARASGRALELYLEACPEMQTDLSKDLREATRNRPFTANDLIHFFNKATGLIIRWADAVYPHWEVVPFESASMRAIGEMRYLFPVPMRPVRLEIGVDPRRPQLPDTPVMWRFVKKEHIDSDHQTTDEHRVDSSQRSFELGEPPPTCEYLEVRLPRDVVPSVAIRLTGGKS